MAEGTWMQLKIQGGTMGQDSPHSNVQSIDLHHELGAVVKQCFRFRNAQSAPGDHVNGTVGEVSAERAEATVL
jgi:hypothetical protein